MPGQVSRALGRREGRVLGFRPCESSYSSPGASADFLSPDAPNPSCTRTRGFLLGDQASRTRVEAERTTQMSESMSGAQALVRSLEEVGADVVFGIPGG